MLSCARVVNPRCSRRLAIGAQLSNVSNLPHHGSSIISHNGGTGGYDSFMKVDPKIFDGYIDRYELAPNFILTITRDGDHLFAQASGQGSFEIFPESQTELFAKVTDLQITFQTTGGQAGGLVVHQLGRDTAAKRLDDQPEKPKS
jgi:hypothetical protein